MSGRVRRSSKQSPSASTRTRSVEPSIEGFVDSPRASPERLPPRRNVDPAAREYRPLQGLCESRRPDSNRGPPFVTSEVVLNLVPISAHLIASEGMGAAPRPPLPSQMHLPRWILKPVRSGSHRLGRLNVCALQLRSSRQLAQAVSGGAERNSEWSRCSKPSAYSSRFSSADGSAPGKNRTCARGLGNHCSIH
jgi:hypothetical protein